MLLEKIKNQFKVLFHRKEIISEWKPKLVFWYLTFRGDQERIKEAIKTKYGLDDELKMAITMSGVDLNQYIMKFEKDFYRWSDNSDDIIVEKRCPKY